MTLSPVDPDPHVAFLIVNTETDDQVPEVVKRVRQHLLENFPGANARVKRMWLGSNEPAFVADTAAYLASLRGCSLEALAETTTANFCRLFRGVKMSGGSPAQNSSS